MPTGYIAQIDDDPNLTTAKWVTEGLSRAFGVCVVLRDGPYDLTEDEIVAHLEKEIGRNTKYHKENISKARETLKVINNNPSAWDDLYTSEIERLHEYNKRSQEEATATKLRHEQIEQDLIKLRDKTTDEVTKNIAKFGLSQLELVKRDREPYLLEIPSLEKFKGNKLASLKRDIKYHTEKMEESEKREMERLRAYQRIRFEVKKILGSQSSTPKVKT